MLREIEHDTTKFCHVVAALDMEISKRIYDILSYLPSQNKYQALKTKTTRRIWDYEARQSLQLATLTELIICDKKHAVKRRSEESCWKERERKRENDRERKRMREKGTERDLKL